MAAEPGEDASRELVERAASGDVEATEQLLRRHLPGLRAFVRLRMGPSLRLKESSADIVQDVLLDAFRDLGEFEYRTEAGFRHWLYARAANRAADRARYYARDKRDAGRETSLDGARHGDGGAHEAEILRSYHTFLTPSRLVSGREELERIEAAFAALPESHREVIVLSRLVGLSHAEIAARMGRSVEAVTTLLSRALARLSTLLEESGPS